MENRGGGEGEGEEMAGQAALMASASVRSGVAPLACSSSSFVKPGGNSDASRCAD